MAHLGQLVHFWTRSRSYMAPFGGPSIAIFIHMHPNQSTVLFFGAFCHWTVSVKFNCVFRSRHSNTAAADSGFATTYRPSHSIRVPAVLVNFPVNMFRAVAAHSCTKGDTGAFANGTLPDLELADDLPSVWKPCKRQVSLGHLGRGVRMLAMLLASPRRDRIDLKLNLALGEKNLDWMDKFFNLAKLNLTN